MGKNTPIFYFTRPLNYDKIITLNDLIIWIKYADILARTGLL